ncbi:hypothetical protein GY45DRAFT_139863 [Cubamyces sp. BRFM 1775]|nr:hypothetical protein GY45DRAFT_139863 [Cubamyces sp. BRFM 1775]
MSGQCEVPSVRKRIIEWLKGHRDTELLLGSTNKEKAWIHHSIRLTTGAGPTGATAPTIHAKIGRALSSSANIRNRPHLSMGKSSPLARIARPVRIGGTLADNAVDAPGGADEPAPPTCSRRAIERCSVSSQRALPFAVARGHSISIFCDAFS